jgi:hypothetical protein
LARNREEEPVMDRNDDERREPGPGDRVGLGRVVRTDTGARGQPASGAVEESSEESFPASDPPGFGSGPATPVDRGGGTGPPGSRDLP